MAGNHLRANPKAARKLNELVRNGIITKSTKPSSVYNDPKYASFFDGVDRDAIRRRLRNLFSEKRNSSTKRTFFHVLSHSTLKMLLIANP